MSRRYARGTTSAGPVTCSSASPLTSIRLRELSIMYGGDISFLGDFLGTSGASGKHPCPHCLVNSDTVPAGSPHALEIVGQMPLPVSDDPTLHFDPELLETGRTSR